jgi:molecular chaperone GrpE
MEEKKDKSSSAKATEDKEKKENQVKEPVVDDSQKKIEELEKQKAEYLAGWQRERADFLNYKKEEMERISGFMAYAGEEMISKMLPILDNFEIVEKNLSEETKKDANIQGLLLIKKQIQDFLKSLGAEEIKSVGEPFDAKVHEVVEERPFDAAQGQKSGEIFEEVQKGYKINGRLMRPAKVKVVK